MAEKSMTRVHHDREQVAVEGSGREATRWFTVRQANASYEHPFHAPLEHALNIDFVDAGRGPQAWVAVELTAESARVLVEAHLAVLGCAEAGSYLNPVATSGGASRNVVAVDSNRGG
ncbi:MAG: DUF6295 family protein [Armatimonadota bacterium]|nr:DUF6295 family protein [Armatimonadota bacterium]MDR7551093.1 DUF6295 family protein [Armatimonadota bacterium]